MPLRFPAAESVPRECASQRESDPAYAMNGAAPCIDQRCRTLSGLGGGMPPSSRLQVDGARAWHWTRAEPNAAKIFRQSRQCRRLARKHSRRLTGLLLRGPDADQSVRRLSKRRKLADIEPYEIHNYIVKPDCFVWSGALFRPDSRTLELMQAELTCMRLPSKMLRHGHQRPKIEEYGDSLFAVLPHDRDLSTASCASASPFNILKRPQLPSSRSESRQRGFSDVRARTESEPKLC